MKELPGRAIESVPYTGLIERLSQISAAATIVSEAPSEFDEATLANLIVQIGELATEAVVFAGATQDEALDAFRQVVSSVSFGPADQ